MVNKLNCQQKSAIQHIEGPALVLAVPGAGKTTVIIHRTANLILNHKVRPDKILSITFSRASARDMKSRFNKQFGNISSIPIRFSTIHSFTFSLLNEYAIRNNLKLTLIEDERKPVSKKKLLRKIYYDINKSYMNEEKLETTINSIGYIKNMLLTVDEYLESYDINIDNFNDIFNSYEKYKRDNFLIDFDDMLTLTLEVLKKDKYLLNKYRNHYDFIQVDEGQDTSKVQNEIIRIIAHPKNNLFIVADDDQSIYGFRGAFPKGLFDFEKNYPKAEIFYMENNYRSTKNIVSVCNDFIKQNTERFNKTIITENPSFRPIHIIKLKNMEDQYQYIVDELSNKKNFNNTAILFRNNLSSIGIIEALDRNNIPFKMKDRKINFFYHWVTKDILSFLSLAYDSSSIEDFERIYYKTRGYIRKDYINFIKTLYYDKSVFYRLTKYPGLKKSFIEEIRKLEIDFNTLSKLKPYDAIDFIQYNLEYNDYLRENSQRFGFSYDALNTIISYLKLIASHTDNYEDFIKRLKYLNYLTYNSKKNKEGVTLSTVHSSKGLEFENIYIIDLIDGEFPIANSIEAFESGNIKPLEEERRLFYVGMTRAEKVLDLITFDYKDGRRVIPSRFIEELEEIINNSSSK